MDLLFLQWSNWSQIFWCKNVKNWKKNYNKVGIYYIGYVTVKKIDDCNNINSVNPLYLMIDEMIGHFEEKNENKYLVLDGVDENKEVWKNIKKIVKVFKKKLKELMLAKKFEHGKDFQKIRFKSKDDLPLNKPIKLRLLTIIIRCVIS